ncbi:MAG: ABC transporter permease [Pseudomonadota bacterium]
MLARLAASELLADWTVSLAVCLAITAAAAPVLVLISLYAGVVSEIFSGLRADPAAREVRLAATGAARFDDAWFETARSWPEVAFAAPSTRYASAQGQLLDAAGSREGRATLLPTGSGDPIFPPDGLSLAGPAQAGLSAGLAARIGAGPGDRALLEITRGGSGGTESAVLEIEIVRVARPSDFGRDALFATPALLAEIEDYKNGHRAPLFGVDGTEPPPRAHFPDFRLYARKIEDVAPLVERLSAEPYNLTLRTESGRIDFATRLDGGLTLVVGAVGALGGLGLAGGLATIQWSMAARRRRTIAVLSLIGFDRASLVGLPVVEALMLGACGAAMTVLAAWGFAELIDALLAADLGIGATRLSAGPVALVTALILFVSVLPALWIGRAYAKLEPSDEIRET